VNQGYDLSQLLTTLAQTVPVWVFVGLAVKHWIKKSTEAAKNIDLRFESIQGDLDMKAEKLTSAIQGIQSSVKVIELNMASANILHVRADIESLREAKVRAEMKAEEALRQIETLRSYAR
jgi:hypothetical protein